MPLIWAPRLIVLCCVLTFMCHCKSKDSDIFSYIKAQRGAFDLKLYQQLVGQANAFKEGDEAIGVAAKNETERQKARQLLANTQISDLHEHPLYSDRIQKRLWENVNLQQYARVKDMTLGDLKSFMLTASEEEIKGVREGLNSDVIAMLVRLMSNDELSSLSQKIFNPLPGSKIGSKGYMGARIQPNSPTDDPQDIAWQVFNAWSFAVGDLMLGTNPVDSQPDSVARIEKSLKEIIDTFQKAYKIPNLLPWVVLSHVDVQAQVEKENPGSTALWFQSLGGTEGANKTFDLSLDALEEHAQTRTGPYGFYFETGQGADFTNGQDYGVDMVTLESRKYGLAAALKKQIPITASNQQGPYVVVNDVAGFIGPEVFKTKEQLLRATLEDTVMGKMHGLTIGLDICATLHMDVSMEDLDWVIERVMPANPAYLMALPTKMDPMLSYLSTSFQDHVRIRQRFGYKVDDTLWKFFKQLEIIDNEGKATEHFGDPRWVYFKYLRAKGDTRPQNTIYKEADAQLASVKARGVPIAIGYDAEPWKLNQELATQIQAEYDIAKKALWSELAPQFLPTIPQALVVHSQSLNQEDYILHPKTGELLSEASQKSLEILAQKRQQAHEDYDVQIVISDGLNANAIMDEGHLVPYLDALSLELKKANLRVAPDNIVLMNGRVRGAYKIGEVLFAQAPANQTRGIILLIGERPGTIHNNFSAYFTFPKASVWQKRGTVDHNIAKVIAGISDTALPPQKAARETVRLLLELRRKN